MSKFNSGKRSVQPPVAATTSQMRTIGGPRSAPDTRTFEGAPAWSRDAKTDLFLRATSSFHGGEKSFYESGDDRDDKLRELVRQIALEDFAWIYQFAEWLRGPGNIRTAALMIAAEAVKARIDAKLPVVGDISCRKLIDVVCQRADEPGEMLAYWQHRYGNQAPRKVKGITPAPQLPMAFKRGLADAARRLYNEHSLLKYDTPSHHIRMADVLELCHPSPHPDKVTWQGDLFQHAIDRRHGRVVGIPESLSTLHANLALREDPRPESWLDAERLKKAGMTWENALSAVGGKIDKAKLWEAMIPNMGYMALLRNLRNFDEAGISNKLAESINAKLMDEGEVARSRQLPFRFYTAYKNAPSLRWAYALETALDLCLPNIPELPGRTLVLTDTSGSMQAMMSGKSSIACAEAAALFGAALARGNQSTADFFQYADCTRRIDLPKGGSVLKVVDSVWRNLGAVGYGTDIAGAVRNEYNGHDRVVIITDAQGCHHGRLTSDNVGTSVPRDVPVYLFNLESTTASPMPTGGAARFDLGGLTDATFALIPRLEAGVTGDWEAIFGMK